MKHSFIPLLFGLVFGLTATTRAQVLMLDFGPNSPSVATNSPYHAANTGFTDTTWNVITSTADASGVFHYSNGDTASVSLKFGTATGTTNTVPATTLTVPSSSLTFSGLGSAENTGVYANSSVATDGVFISGGSNSTFATVGLQIGGLAAGTYDIYVTARNTNSTAAYRQNIYAGTSASSGNFTYANSSSGTSGSAVGTAASGYSLATVGYSNGTSGLTSWTEATSGNIFGNYVKLSVVLTSGEFLNLAVTGQFAEDRGFLNSVQIVSTSPIPEPSTYALMAGFAALAFVAVRRRRA